MIKNIIAVHNSIKYELNMYNDLRCICNNLIHISNLGKVLCDECKRIYIIEVKKGYCYSCHKQMAYIIDKVGLRRCKECRAYIIDK